MMMVVNLLSFPACWRGCESLHSHGVCPQTRWRSVWLWVWRWRLEPSSASSCSCYTGGARQCTVFLRGFIHCNALEMIFNEHITKTIHNQAFAELTYPVVSRQAAVHSEQQRPDWLHVQPWWLWNQCEWAAKSSSYTLRVDITWLFLPFFRAHETEKKLWHSPTLCMMCLPTKLWIHPILSALLLNYF